MIELLKNFFGLLGTFFDWLRNKNLEQAGRNAANAEQQAKVNDDVQKAQDALSINDPARDERLRRKYDRARE